MNEADAKALTDRIVGTWPASPKGFVWTDQLLPLDAAVARAAVAQLTREHEEARLPVARFLAVYRASERAGNPGRRPSVAASHDGPPMSFTEYLARLTWRAGTGDAEANAVLDVWSTPFAQKMLAILQGDT